jgi:hypothetical protein
MLKNKLYISFGEVTLCPPMDCVVGVTQYFAHMPGLS